MIYFFNLSSPLIKLIHFYFYLFFLSVGHFPGKTQNQSVRQMSDAVTEQWFKLKKKKKKKVWKCLTFNFFAVHHFNEGGFFFNASETWEWRNFPVNVWTDMIDNGCVDEGQQKVRHWACHPPTHCPLPAPRLGKWGICRMCESLNWPHAPETYILPIFNNAADTQFVSHIATTL